MPPEADAVLQKPIRYLHQMREEPYFHSLRLWKCGSKVLSRPAAATKSAACCCRPAAAAKSAAGRQQQQQSAKPAGSNSKECCRPAAAKAVRVLVPQSPLASKYECCRPAASSKVLSRPAAAKC